MKQKARRLWRHRREVLLWLIRWLLSWLVYGLQMLWYYIRRLAWAVWMAHLAGVERDARRHDPEPWEDEEGPDDVEQLEEQRKTLCLLLEAIAEELEETTDRRRTTELLNKKAITQAKLHKIDQAINSAIWA